MQLSKNGVGLSVLLIEGILSMLGIEFEPGSVAKFVEAVLVALSFLLLIWNQIDRHDVSAFLFKK